MTPFDRFATLVQRSDDARLPLLETAALVPQYADPDFEPQAVVEQVCSWGKRLSQRVAADASELTRLRMLNHFFFGELGFHGARDDYQAASNSYLHRVIERRRGIPITLSLLYLELGERIGLGLQGVSFPGHFLVKLPQQEGALILDVFGGGTILSAGDLRARLQAALPHPDEQALAPYLRAATRRDILARLLRNLKAIHWQAQDWPAALEVMNRLIAVVPKVAQERRDRSRVFELLQCPRAAADDLAAYLCLHPAPADAAQARERLQQLRHSATRLH